MAAKLSPVDFYEGHVLPAVFGSLDRVFPELGLVRKDGGWIAGNTGETKARFGARADRVVCNRAGGFLVHGQGPVSWLAYLNNGTTPRGADFVAALKDLAYKAGIDCSPLDRRLNAAEFADLDAAAQSLEERQGRDGLLEDFVAVTKAALVAPVGAAGRTYLEARTFTPAELSSLPVGFYESVEAVRAAMLALGHTDEALKASGILHDGRWTGRVVFPFRGTSGRVETVVARDLTGKAEAAQKYLKLKDARQVSPLFGLDVALPSARRDGLLVVEGCFDVILLHARGFANVAATGANFGMLTRERWEELGRLGLPSVTLATDNDPKADGTWPGREMLTKALGNLANVSNVAKVPKVYVIPPAALGTAKDPDELVRAGGVEALREVLTKAEPWVLDYAREGVLGDVTPASPYADKDAAARRAVAFCGGLRGENALHEDAVLELAATRTGYSFAAIADLAADARKMRDAEVAKVDLADVAATLEADLAKPGADAFTLAAKAAKALEAIQGRASTGDTPPVFSVDALLAEIRDTPEGLSWGLSPIDNLGVRFRPKELAILAARVGHGKTSTLVNLLAAWFALDTLPGPLVFFSHEEPPESIFLRLAVLLAFDDNKPAWTFSEARDFLRDPNCRGSNHGWPNRKALDAAVERIRDNEKHLHLIHRPGWSAPRLAAHARELADANGGLGAVFVDYLQRIPAETRGDRRDIEVSATGRALKSLAVDLVVPVVTGGQINREAIPDKYQANIREKAAKGIREVEEYMKGARPDLHNLREGGSEQEADLVLGLMNYAADLRTEAGDAASTTRYEIGVLKNRYGQVGKWGVVAFEGERGRIHDPSGFGVLK